MKERRSKPPEAAAKSEDVVLVHGMTEDGKGYRVVRKRGEELALGAVRPLEDGKPIHGELVRLKQRAELPVLFDVLPAESADAADDGAAAGSEGRGGPAMVASDAYRSGWDGIWGTLSKRGAKPLPN